MDSDTATACFEHLDAAERLLRADGDAASLARLAYVIDMLRRRLGLPDRPLELSDLA